MTDDIEHLSYVYLPSVCLLWWNVCSNILPIKNFVLIVLLLLSCEGLLNTLDTSHLWGTSFPNIFSQSVAWVFIFWTVSFKTAVFNLDKVKFVKFFSFMVSALFPSQKFCAFLKVTKITSHFFPGNCIVLGFTFFPSDPFWAIVF